MLNGQTQDFVDIRNQNAVSFAVSAVAAKSPSLPRGMYDVVCTVDCWIRVAPINNRGILVTAPNRAEDVTTANGYPLFAGNVVSFGVEEGDQIGAIAGGAGTLTYTKTG